MSSHLTVEEQVIRIGRRAWFNVIVSKLTKETPDVDYIITLYIEIRKKIIDLIMNENVKKTVRETLDVELFRQMVKNDSFNKDDFNKLVVYCFDLCLKLGSPGRDDNTKKLRQEVFDEFETNGMKGIARFFLNINICIDYIYKDIINIVNST